MLVTGQLSASVLPPNKDIN